jgi:hypothetical protein
MADTANAEGGSGAQPYTGILIAYAVTIFGSAFLLFQVQPLISKFILPWFGGSPAVWTAAMLFFQSALCAGYAYAHISTRFLSARGQFYTHVALLVIAAVVTLATRIMPAEALKPTGNEDSPLLLILLLLTTTVGLPYFVLSSTGPLLQKWFSDAFQGVSPYRLFALSNVGSLVALVSYPFFFEVQFDSRQQATMWTYGFVLFAALCAYCAWWTFQAIAGRETGGAAAAVPSKQGEASPAPSWRLWLTWIALPALASVFFLAITNEVCQNIATVPLLWVIPLSLYLFSFIVAFDSPRWYSRTLYCGAAIVLLGVMSNYDPVTETVDACLNWLAGYGDEDPKRFRLYYSTDLQYSLYFVALFVVCAICHCEMARLRPSPKYLTAYFMTMSIGGAIGGVLVNLLCPYIFKTFFEFSLSMIVGVVLAMALLLLPKVNEQGKPVLQLDRLVTWDEIRGAIGLIGGLIAVGAMIFSIAENWQDDKPTWKSGTVYRARNFYGLVSVQHRARFKVENSSEGQSEESANRIPDPDVHFTFVSGHVKHGRQYALPDQRQRIDTSYYGGPGSGCRLTMDYATKRPDCKVGMIGLGIGTVAGYLGQGQSMRAYDINPEVKKIAQNTEWFTYLSDAEKRGAKIDIVLGDARLQLENDLKKGPLELDVLILDAFSGDAIPTHLLTDEAFAVYKQHMKPDGIICVNITNTYLNLYPVVRELAKKHGYQWTRVYDDGIVDESPLLYRSYWMMLTNDEAFLKQTPSDIADMDKGPRHQKFKRDAEVPLWTDRYSNLWQIMLP